MTESPLTGVLSDLGLAQSGSRDTITRIKGAAIRELEALDSHVRINSTEYFNHSYAPDLVLTWPRGREADRFVYIRASDRVGALAEDVERVGDQRPIVLGIATLHREQDVEGHDRLNSVARERDTLVTNAPAIQTLAASKRERPVTGLLSTALARGGRGLVDDSEARSVTEVVAQGFAGASTMGADSIVKAYGALEQHLAAPYSARFSRLLQAVWVGSGGRTDLFPIVRDLEAGVDDESLEFLLNLDPIDDVDFWYRLGRTLTVEQLGRLSPEQPSANLQRLVKANLDHLWARDLRIQDREPQLDEQDQPTFWWRTDRGNLALRSASWIGFVAEKTEDLGEIQGTAGDGISVEELRERAQGVALTGLQLSDGRDELDLLSLVNEDVVQGDRLAAVAASFGAGARVRRARAGLSDGRQLTCDFTRSSASAVTRSMPPLSELLGVAVPLLRPMQEEEKAALNELLQAVGGSHQLAFTTSDESPDLDPLF